VSAAERRLVKVAVVDRPATLAFGSGGSGRRVGDLLAQALQVSVDGEKLDGQRAAQRRELHLDQAHAQVLRVHEHEEHQHQQVDALPVHGDKPRHVDGQRDAQVHDGAQRAEQRTVPALRGRRGRVRVVGPHVPFVQRQGSGAPVRQRGVRHQTRRGHRPRVHAVRRGERADRAPAVQQAQHSRRHDEVENARGQQRNQADSGQRFPRRPRNHDVFVRNTCREKEAAGFTDRACKYIDTAGFSCYFAHYNVLRSTRTIYIYTYKSSNMCSNARRIYRTVNKYYNNVISSMLRLIGRYEK